MTFDCNLKSMKSWLGTKNLAFDNGYNVPTLYSLKSTKAFFNLQEMWHSPNLLLNVVHGQAFNSVYLYSHTAKYKGTRGTELLPPFWVLIYFQ
jgi:hypothetical protein